MGYVTRFIPQETTGKLLEYWHTAKIQHPLDRHKRMLLTVKWFMDAHPDLKCTSTGVYKDLDGLIEGY